MDCIGPAAPGVLDVSVEVLRAGKSLSHARATLSQAGATCAILLGTFGQARASQLAVAGRASPRPDAPPEAFAQLPFVAGLTPAFTRHFDFRWTSRAALFSGAERGELSGYVRPLSADRVDSAVIAALLDAFPPPILTQLTQPAPTSTVTWLANFNGLPPEAPPPAAQDYCYYASSTNSASDGYVSFDAALWDSSGRLLADSRQLTVEFSRLA
jgi:acyl-CoA thioesterase